MFSWRSKTKEIVDSVPDPTCKAHMHVFLSAVHGSWVHVVHSHRPILGWWVGWGMRMPEDWSNHWQHGLSSLSSYLWQYIQYQKTNRIRGMCDRQIALNHTTPTSRSGNDSVPCPTCNAHMHVFLSWAHGSWVHVVHSHRPTDPRTTILAPWFFVCIIILSNSFRIVHVCAFFGDSESSAHAVSTFVRCVHGLASGLSHLHLYNLCGGCYLRLSDVILSGGARWEQAIWYRNVVVCGTSALNVTFVYTFSNIFLYIYI
jgi:hypothetical protein